jgi:hypothetical protein
MPHDPIKLKEDVVLKDAPGAHDSIIITKHEAPANADNSVAVDPYKAKDLEVAGTMMAWLKKHYPGHMWGVVADLRQGIVKFNIPILMGVNHWWVVNLSTHDIIDGVRQGAGQILERYGLRRGRFELNSFLEARAHHSALVMPGRPVPEYAGQIFDRDALKRKKFKLITE